MVTNIKNMSQKQYLVKDFMSDKVASINESANIRQAMAELVAKKTNGLVVIDNNNKPIGVISTRDIIKEVVPDYLENEDHLSAFEAESTFAVRVNAIADQPIVGIMTKNIHTAHPNDTLMEAASMLTKNGIRQLPVVDDNESLIGYINRTDIKRAIGEILFST